VIQDATLKAFTGRTSLCRSQRHSSNRSCLKAPSMCPLLPYFYSR
jgi:hypothetical protein